jgi:hypothetical protein
MDGTTDQSFGLNWSLRLDDFQELTANEKKLLLNYILPPSLSLISTFFRENPKAQDNSITNPGNDWMASTNDDLLHPMFCAVYAKLAFSAGVQRSNVLKLSQTSVLNELITNAALREINVHDLKHTFYFAPETIKNRKVIPNQDQMDQIRCFRFQNFTILNTHKIHFPQDHDNFLYQLYTPAQKEQFKNGLITKLEQKFPNFKDHLKIAMLISLCISDLFAELPDYYPSLEDSLTYLYEENRTAFVKGVTQAINNYIKSPFKENEKGTLFSQAILMNKDSLRSWRPEESISEKLQQIEKLVGVLYDAAPYLCTA